MDPLSITVGIIALLQATNKVITVCYDFRAAVKEAPWSLTRTLDEIKDLRNVLETLEGLVDQPECIASKHLEERPALRLLQNSKDGPLASCLRELERLQEKIGSPNYARQPGTKRRALAEALKWRLKDRDATLCLERIERCKSTLKLAMHADEMTMLNGIWTMTAALKDGTQSTNNKIAELHLEIRSKETDARNRKVLQWLSPIDPSESHETAVEVYQKGTSEWFIQCAEFRDWFRGRGGLLWLSGFPGAGKTIIFAKIVAYLTQALHDLPEEGQLAYFYCDFRKNESQKPLNVIGSLVAQLCSASGQFPSELVDAFNGKRDSCGRSQRPGFEVLKQALQWFAREQKLILLVDAIDECEARGSLLNHIRILEAESENLSFLLTSRNESDIRDRLLTYPRVTLESHSEEVDHDIGSYIENRLKLDQNLQWLDASIRAEISYHIRSRSKGMFQWAQCQIDSIGRARTVKAIRAALKELPVGLDETYRRILTRIPTSDAETTRRVLLWLAFSMRRLTLNELHTAIAINPELDHLDEESQLRSAHDILELCGSLISVSDQGHVSLAHLSVKDYLLSAEIKLQPSVSIFTLSAPEANHELASNCIGYMMFKEFSKGPAPTSDDYVARLSNYTLMKHAAVAWPYYFRASEPSPELRCLASRFFSPSLRENFMSWVQILNAGDVSEWDFYPRHATSLYYASSFGLSDVVEELIRAGADLDTPGSRYQGTALQAAVLRNQLRVMKLLLRAGADPNRPDKNGTSPLHFAAALGSLHSVAILVQYGASKESIGNLGDTPVDWAEKAGRQDAVDMILGRMDPDILDLDDSVQQGVWYPYKTYFPSSAGRK
ncbi:hypothetical protein PVAG01_11181 [Phlyctema vagabunda]|uniref:NACHT domain-containing protein n=1 Tax=Phlyctema vagabunda TaxID=108571 RepID=A0ABR4P1K1_9HELO